MTDGAPDKTKQGGGHNEEDMETDGLKTEEETGFVPSTEMERTALCSGGAK